MIARASSTAWTRRTPRETRTLGAYRSRVRTSRLAFSGLAPVASPLLANLTAGEDKANLLRWFAVPPRPCLVTIADARGVRHSVEVTAESVFDAAAKGLAALAGHEWTERVGPATRVEVQVIAPVVTHTVAVRQLARWAESSAASPEERLRKDRVRRLLAGPPPAASRQAGRG
jgi:hypothetical protein